MENKIILNYETFKDKVYACWVGKNIGGTMGAPYEYTRDILDVKGFATEPSVVLPNDDLDLQLVWLLAVEKIGAKAITTATLGEFWLSFIVPNWNEYGIGKTNLERGLMAPLSGDYQNDWQNSNGAWIRTEIWACLAPGAPDVASKYSIADAQVDHGAGEGTYAAAFVSAMQSSAFVINDLRKCIEIGLSKIPENCRMADSVRTVLKCYDEGKTAIETRNIILERNMDIGNGWFESPSNVSYAIIGLLYGGGDFKKSMLTAINCGDDTDCTAATVGATLGILGGMDIIPKDWQRHIGDDIITVSINRASVGREVPKTCTELCNRAVKQAPYMLFSNHANVEIANTKTEIPSNIYDVLINNDNFKGIIENIKPSTITFDCAFLNATVCYNSDPEISKNGEKKIDITFINNTNAFDNRRYNLEFRWWLPSGFSVETNKQTMKLCYANSHIDGKLHYSVIIRAGETVEAMNRCVLEVTAVGRSIPMYIPITLLG